MSADALNWPVSRRLARPPGIGYLPFIMNLLTRKAGHGASVRLAALLLPLLVLGCSQRMMAPTASPSGDQAPVQLRNFEVTAADGHRAVLLRLSRLPTLVRQSSSSRPARITVEAWGPPGDTDLPTRELPQTDPQITDVTVSRKSGALTVVIELKGDDPPAYTVQQMADWIMIRFPGTAS